MLPGCHPAQGKATLSAAELLSCFVLPDASEDEAEAAGFRAEGSRAHAFFHELISDDLAFDEARRPAFSSAPSLPALPLHPPDTCCPARPGGQACRRRLFEWCTALRALPSAGLKDKIRLKLCRSGLSVAPPAPEASSPLPCLGPVGPQGWCKGRTVRPRALAARHTRPKRAGTCPDTER